jgi:hypothetical protein
VTASDRASAPGLLRLAVDRRVCFYCLHQAESERATSVVHDARGCVPCCQRHARWRATSTSHLHGHHECLLGRTGLDEVFEHVTVLP